MIETNALLSNCGSQSEFVEKAVRFYDGYLKAQSAGAFLPHAVADVLEGTLGVFANRMGQHRICLVCGEAAALPNAPGGAWPHTPFSGKSPDPLKDPQLSEGTREIISERSLTMKKDIKFSTRMASADREKIKALAAKAHMSTSDYVTACCLGKRIVVIDEQKELLRQLKGIGSNINRLTVLRCV